MKTKQEKEALSKIGYYGFYKMKALDMTLEEYKQYVLEKREKNKLKREVGYYKFKKCEELKINLIEYPKYKEEKHKTAERTRHRKNKTRFRTIRYIERHCNIERKCQFCGKKAEIHHLDYNNDYLINLLCKKHHILVHKKEMKTPTAIDLRNYKKEDKLCDKTG